MSQDLNFSNCVYTRALIPAISGTASYEMSAEWGSRLAVHIGRAHGLCGMGTIPMSIATYIAFPSGYFSHAPMVKVLVCIEPAAPDAPYFSPAIRQCGSNISTNGFLIENPYSPSGAPSTLISWTARGV